MENKDKIEIPFGAKDSELYECEYTIPEGYEAEIKDGKVIIRKKESEDEKIRKEIIDFVKNRGGFKGEWIAWLEKKGEQKPTAWSEEDEKILSDIVKDLVNPWNEYIPDRIEDEIKWLKNKLKSLKDRVQFQPQWKPSDGQMESITCAVRKMKESACYDSVLVHLLQDLKKLRGE
jgi:hypothetical protein